MRAPAFLAALLLALAAGACTSFDRDAKTPLASVDTTSQPSALRPALVDVFGKRGLRSGHPSSNPMFFEGRANKAELFAYKDLGDWDTLIVERAHVDLVPIAGGTRVQARVQIISNPDSVFEDAKFPLLGMRKRYQRMLEEAAALAAGGPLPADARSSPAALQNYSVPLPLEGR